MHVIVTDYLFLNKHPVLILTQETYSTSSARFMIILANHFSANRGEVIFFLNRVDCGPYTLSLTVHIIIVLLLEQYARYVFLSILKYSMQ